jgi:hypothetical protein
MTSFKILQVAIPYVRKSSNFMFFFVVESYDFVQNFAPIFSSRFVINLKWKKENIFNKYT